MKTISRAKRGVAAVLCGTLMACEAGADEPTGSVAAAVHPSVPESRVATGDFDNDDRADLWIKNGSTSFIDYGYNDYGQMDFIAPGWAAGVSPAALLPGDYDGDFKTDLSYKGKDGYWRISYAKLGFSTWHLNLPGYGDTGYFRPVPADYDGDDKTDLSQKDDGGRWYIEYAGDADGLDPNWDAVYFGFGNDWFTPVPADYDGDGAADLATKDGDGYWYVEYTQDADGVDSNWDAIYSGFGGDYFEPVPADYDGDGRADLSTRDQSGRWFVDYSENGVNEPAWDFIGTGFGDASSVPQPADYDDDGKADPAVAFPGEPGWGFSFSTAAPHAFNLVVYYALPGAPGVALAERTENSLTFDVGAGTRSVELVTWLDGRAVQVTTEKTVRRVIGGLQPSRLYCFNAKSRNKRGESTTTRLCASTRASDDDGPGPGPIPAAH